MMMMNTSPLYSVKQRDPFPNISTVDDMTVLATCIELCTEMERFPYVEDLVLNNNNEPITTDDATQVKNRPKSHQILCNHLLKSANCASHIKNLSIVDSECEDASCAQTYLVAELRLEQEDERDISTTVKHLVIVFKSCSMLSDVLLDTTILRNIPNIQNSEGSFHAGYYNRASKVPIEPFVQLVVNQGYRITVAGHSVGGAIATLFTARLLNDFSIRDKSDMIQCITFGSPLCVNGHFPMQSTRNESRENRFNHYLLSNDPVPSLLTRVEDARMNDAKNLGEKRLNELKDLVCATLPLYLDCFTLGDKSSSSLLSLVTSHLSLTTGRQKQVSDIEREALLNQLLNELSEIIQSLGNSYDRHFVAMGKFYEATQSQDSVSIGVLNGAVVQNSFSSLDLELDTTSKHLPNHSMKAYRSTLFDILKHQHNFTPDTVIEQHVDFKRFMGSTFTLLDIPKEWVNSHDNNNDNTISSHYSVVQVEFSDKKLHEVKLTLNGSNMSLCGKLKCGSAIGDPIILREESSNEKAVFLFNTKSHLDSSGLQVTVISHFNTVDIMITPPYSTEVVNNCKEERLSNMELMHLYTFAMSYSLFAGARNPLITEIQGEETSDEGFVVIDKKQMDTRADVKRLNQQRERMFRLLHDVEQLWSSPPLKLEMENEELQKEWNARIMIIKGKLADWEQLMALTFNSDTSSNLILNDIKFSSQVIPLTEIVKQFQDDRELTVVDAMARSLPYLLALFNKIYNRELQVVMSTHKKILVCAVGAVVGGGIFVISGGTALAFGGSLLGGIATSILGGAMLKASLNREKLNNQYKAWLSLLATSLGINMDEKRSTLFSYESRIWEYCHHNYSITSKSDDEIKKNWSSIFKTGILQDVEDRDFVLKLLKTVWKHYLMRKHLISGVAVGVVGESQVGKSYLSYLLFECGDDSTFGMKTRSTDMTLYYRSNNFCLIDFPHIDSSDQSFKACFIANHNMVDAVIVVLDIKGEGRTSDQERIVKVIQQLDVPYLVCFNRADTLFKNEFNTGHKLPKHLELLKQRTAAKHQALLTPEDIERRRIQYARYLNIDEDNVMITCFSNQQHGLSDEVLEKAGVKNEMHVREWILNFVSHANLLPQMEIQELRDYMSEQSIIERHLKRCEQQGIVVDALERYDI